MRTIIKTALVLILLFSGFYVAAQDYSISMLPFSTENYDEISPVYYKGNIVFSSNRKNSIFFTYYDEKGGMPLFDLFVVEESKDSEWKVGALDKSFNTNYNEGPAAFNSRGNEIYFTRNNVINRKLKNDNSENNTIGIYYSKFNRKTGWGAPEPFQYNSENYNVAHPSLSEDETLLFFASDMEGGFGGSDIYVCVKQANSWGEPKNLGPKINTSGNEFFPFIHSTGRLYFSSDKHEGMGRLDVFYSEAVNGEWHKPIHMDPPINSRFNDFGLIIDGFKKSGLFCSDRSRKSDDIYSFSPLYPMFEYSKRQEELDYCYVLFEEGAESLDESLYEYEWSTGDGKKIRGVEVEHCYQGPGDYTVELNVIDKLTGDVSYTQAKYDLNIEEIQQVYINAPDTVEVGKEVRFDGYKTVIKDFEIYRYYWDFGDGRKTRGIEAAHIYSSQGNYIVQLGVVSKNDKDGNSEKRGVYKNIVVVGDLKERNRRGQ